MTVFQKLEYNWTSHRPQESYNGAWVLSGHSGCHLRNSTHLLPAPTAKTLAMRILLLLPPKFFSPKAFSLLNNAP